MSLISALGVNAAMASPMVAFCTQDEIELGEAALQLQQLNGEMDTVNHGIDRLLDHHDVVTHFADKGPDVMRLAALNLAADMMDMGMSQNEAKLASAGLESESVDNVGNEAWATITKAVKDLIDWAAKKLDEAIAWATKLFNKYFGAFETMKKSWEKIQKQAESKTEMVIDKDKKDAEYTRSADFYHIGDSVQTVSNLADFGKKLTVYVSNTIKLMSDKEVKEVEKEDILNAEGKRLPVDNLVTNFPRAFPSQTGINFSTLSGDDSYNRVSEQLPGRVKIFSNNRNGSEKLTGDEAYSKFLEEIKGAKISIKPAELKQKAKEKAKVSFVSASDVASIASDQIELLDNLIDLMRGAAMKKADKALKSASKSLKGWNKDVPSDDAEVEEKNAYKYAVKVATAWVGYERRRFLSQPAALASYIRQYSGALATVCKDSLSAHTKP